MTPPARLVANIGDFSIYRTVSGGKAGKGNAKTFSLQIVDRDRCIAKRFTVQIAVPNSGRDAARKCREWIRDNGAKHYEERMARYSRMRESAVESVPKP